MIVWAAAVAGQTLLARSLGDSLASSLFLSVPTLADSAAESTLSDPSERMTRALGFFADSIAGRLNRDEFAEFYHRVNKYLPLDDVERCDRAFERHTDRYWTYCILAIARAASKEAGVTDEIWPKMQAMCASLSESIPAPLAASGWPGARKAKWNGRWPDVLQLTEGQAQMFKEHLTKIQDWLRPTVHMTERGTDAYPNVSKILSELREKGLLELKHGRDAEVVDVNGYHLPEWMVASFMPTIAGPW